MASFIHRSTLIASLFLVGWASDLAKATFSSYSPAANEDEWLNGEPKRGSICATAALPSQLKAAETWLSYSTSIFTQKGPQPRPSSLQQESLSSMHYGSISEPIEPLHGIGRHPFSNVGCFWPRNSHGPIKQKVISEEISSRLSRTGLFDISYLILQNHCDGPVPITRTGRNVLFDLGASSGFAGFNSSRGIPARAVSDGSALGGSLPLFYRMYKDRCQEFDEVFAWEVSQHPPGEWWGSLPAEIRHKVHFYNVPVDESLMPDGSPNPSSFLSLLLAAVKPEDNVVVKLDIDFPQLEQHIMKEILENPELTVLIDELFFEDHYFFDGLNFGWNALEPKRKDRKRRKKVAEGAPFMDEMKRGPISETDGDVDSALRLFRNLREKGIRSHFWI